MISVYRLSHTKLSKVFSPFFFSKLPRHRCQSKTAARQAAAPRLPCQEKEQSEDFKLNDIGRIVIKTADPLAFDSYEVNKANGGAILVDSRTNLTVGALMLRSVAD